MAVRVNLVRLEQTDPSDNLRRESQVFLGELFDRCIAAFHQRTQVKQ